MGWMETLDSPTVKTILAVVAASGIGGSAYLGHEVDSCAEMLVGSETRHQVEREAAAARYERGREALEIHNSDVCQGHIDHIEGIRKECSERLTTCLARQ